VETQCWRLCSSRKKADQIFEPRRRVIEAIGLKDNRMDNV
jgi:hypothetical protein